MGFVYIVPTLGLRDSRPIRERGTLLLLRRDSDGNTLTYKGNLRRFRLEEEVGKEHYLEDMSVEALVGGLGDDLVDPLEGGAD